MDKVSLGSESMDKSLDPMVLHTME